MRGETLVMTLDEARRLLGLSGDEDAATVRRAYRRAIDRRQAQGDTDAIRQVEEAYEIVRDAGVIASIDAPVRRPRQAPWENWYAWVLVFMVIIAARAVFGVVRAAIVSVETQDQAQSAVSFEPPVPAPEPAPAPADPIENFARLADNAREVALARRVRELASELESNDCDKARQSFEDVEQRTHAAQLSWLTVALEPVRTEYGRFCGSLE